MKKLLFLALLIPNFALAQVKVIKAPASCGFRDMGYDPSTGQVGIVGYEVSGSTKIAKVFGINSTNDGFTSTTLVGLGTGTQVFGISSDASRLAGISKSPGSVGAGEGTTWLRSAPSSPVGIGFLVGNTKTSTAFAAWKNGVVGECSGGDSACKWSTTTAVTALPNGGGLGVAFDVSADGLTAVGFFSDSICQGNACYWDTTNAHKLQDPYNVDSIAYSISPSGSYIGGYVGEFDQFDNDYINAAVWDSNKNLILLKDSNGNRFEGKVLDISDLGYAVGETRDGKGFIWHPSFDGVKSSYKGAQIFDTWLATIPNGVVLSPASKGVEAIAEDKVNGKLLFALSDYEAPGASFFVSAVVAGVGNGGDKPTHVGTAGNDTFNITANTANQKIYVQGLGGNDTINITVTASGVSAKIEAGTGQDKITLTANSVSNLKSTVISGDEVDTVSLNSNSGINVDSNFDLGEGNDIFTINFTNVKTAIVGVKAQGGLDRINSNVTNSVGIVTAYDLGAGDDVVTTNTTSTTSTPVDLNLAINGSLGNNTLNMTASGVILTQGVMLGNGKNKITATNTKANSSVIAYNFGYGANTYNATHSYSSNSQISFVEPKLAAGITNSIKLGFTRSSNISVNHSTLNAQSVGITQTSSTGIQYKKSTTLPAGVSNGTQVYNSIVNTFNPYN